MPCRPPESSTSTPTSPTRPSSPRAARVLRDGGLVAFATETVYGLGADATNPEAVARIFQAKGRPPTNPLIVHVQDKAAALACVAEWPARADVLADRFWPGPLTLVLPRSKLIPDLVTAEQDTVGVRVPRPPVARRLILEAGRPIAAPSANRSNRISPTEARHVLDDLDGRVDLILDSGSTTVGVESTVLDLSTDRPRILRPGRIISEELAEVLGEPVEDLGMSLDVPAELKSPGRMATHYAPRTPAYRIDRDADRAYPVEGRFGTLIFGETPDRDRLPFGYVSSDRVRVRSRSGPVEAEASLYADLHEFDALRLDFLLIIPPPDEPRWRAIRDRIWRATEPWPD